MSDTIDAQGPALSYGLLRRLETAARARGPQPHRERDFMVSQHWVNRAVACDLIEAEPAKRGEIIFTAEGNKAVMDAFERAYGPAIEEWLKQP